MTWLRAMVCSGVLIAGCTGGGGPEGPPIAGLSATELAFGEVPVGTIGEQRVALSNDGGEPLEVLSVTLVQGDDSVWSLSRDPDGDVAAGGSSDIVVAFSPDVPEAEESGRVQIRTNDSTTGPLFIELSGSGAPSTVDNDGDGFSPADGDCDDDRDTVYPGAPEICDGRDNDCDGSTPANEEDGDRDGVRICADDCDDTDDQVYPGAPEICDDKDSDCDGSTPDRLDEDGDGFSICDDDCDDDEPLVSPGLTELCDGFDNDCSGEVDDIDEDGDGRSVCRGDCDDDDNTVYSVAVDASYGGGDSDGSDAKPYPDLATALDNLEPTCHTVFLVDDEYEVSIDLKDADELDVLGETRSGVVLKPDGGIGRVANVLDGAHLTLRNLTVTEGAGTGDGGALQAAFADLSLRSVDLVDNAAGADGGAVSVASGTLTLRDVSATGNSATDDGGAIAVFSGVLDVDDCTFDNNEGNRGGAVLAEGTTLVLSASTLTNNTARDTGGAVQIQGGSRHVVQRLLLTGNTASNGGGGLAISDLNDAAAVFRNMSLMENDGGTVGGGISVSGASAALTVQNNSFTGNEADNAGSGIHVASASASGVDLVSNLVAWSDGGSGIEVQSGSGAVVRYCLVFATSPGADFGGGASVSDEGNQSANPQFVAWDDDGNPDDDLSLRSGSPARNAGPTGSGFNDKDGSRNDIGVTGGPFAE